MLPKKNITPDEFKSLVSDTGKTIDELASILNVGAYRLKSAGFKGASRRPPSYLLILALHFLAEKESET